MLMTAPRPRSTAAGPPRGPGPAWERPGARPCSLPRQPSLLASHRDEGEHIAFEPLRGKRLFELGDDRRHAALAVATLHDFAGTAIELDHALGVQQHVTVL